MSRILIVASSEFLTLVRTKAFLIGVLLMPVFMGGAIAFQQFTEKRLDTRTRSFAVLDHTGKVYPVLAAATEAWNQRAVGADGVPHAPTFVAKLEKPGTESLERVRLRLSDAVKQGELFAFLEVPKEVLGASLDPPAKVQYHSNHPSYETLPRFGGARRHHRGDRGMGGGQDLPNRAPDARQIRERRGDDSLGAGELTLFTAECAESINCSFPVCESRGFRGDGSL